MEVKTIAQVDTTDQALVLMRCVNGIYRLEQQDGTFELTRLARDEYERYCFGDPILSLYVGSLTEALAIAKDFISEMESVMVDKDKA